MPPTVRPARPEDFPTLARLLELYQYDLCDIWPQALDAQARYGYDLTRHRTGGADGRSKAYLAWDGDQPVGFALTAPAAVTRQDGLWMEQFFVHRRHRGTGVGRALARHVLLDNPGPWEIGQMPANEAARAFWRRIVGELTRGRFTEVEVDAGWWQGVVQRFEVAAAAAARDP